MHRRHFIRGAAAGPFCFGPDAWAAVSDEGPRRLIVILLRGAVDGLNVVIPYADGTYYQERQSIAIAPPGKPDGALALDGHFGLHPALASLMPLWTERKLAFVHAAGSPDPTRSHFDAQLYIENGTPGQDTTRDGWMNRLLLVLPGPRGATDAISIGPTVPRILAGKAPVATLPLGSNGARPLPLDQPEIARAFDRLYSGDDDLARSYREGRTARAELISALSKERQIADNGAPPPTGFPGQAARLALLIRNHRSGHNPRFACALPSSPPPPGLGPPAIMAPAHKSCHRRRLARAMSVASCPACPGGVHCRMILNAAWKLIGLPDVLLSSHRNHTAGRGVKP